MPAWRLGAAPSLLLPTKTNSQSRTFECFKCKIVIPEYYSNQENQNWMNGELLLVVNEKICCVDILYVFTCI